MTPFLKRDLCRSWWMCHSRQQEDPPCLGTLYSARTNGGLLVCFPAVAGLCLPVLNLLLDWAEVCLNSVGIMFYLPAIPIYVTISLSVSSSLNASEEEEVVRRAWVAPWPFCVVWMAAGELPVPSLLSRFHFVPLRYGNLECCLRTSSAAVTFVKN